MLPLLLQARPLPCSNPPPSLPHLCSRRMPSSYSNRFTRLSCPTSAALKATRRRWPSASCKQSSRTRGTNGAFLSSSNQWAVQAACRCHAAACTGATAGRPPSQPCPCLRDAVVGAKVLVLAGHRHRAAQRAQRGGGQLVGQVALQGQREMVQVKRGGSGAPSAADSAAQHRPCCSLSPAAAPAPQHHPAPPHLVQRQQLAAPAHHAGVGDALRWVRQARSMAVVGRTLRLPCKAAAPCTTAPPPHHCHRTLTDKSKGLKKRPPAGLPTAKAPRYSMRCARCSATNPSVLT